jgi:hypothetical protein
MERVRANAEAAPPYVVTCIDTDADAGDEHHHVVAVETRDPDGGQTRWTGPQALAAVEEGERFAFSDIGRGTRTLLGPATCPACDFPTLTFGADGPTAPRCD